MNVHQSSGVTIEIEPLSPSRLRLRVSGPISPEPIQINMSYCEAFNMATRIKAAVTVFVHGDRRLPKTS